MNNLLDTFKEDLSIFFDEISEKIYINGIPMNIIIDYDRLKDRSKKEYDGIHVGDILFFAKVDDFINSPEVDQVITFNRRKYLIFDVRVDVGIYEIILKGAVS
jgi:hypothetical protein|nr:MAG TPA: ATP-binding sugar transporter [Bacteriophage sp.]